MMKDYRRMMRQIMLSDEKKEEIMDMLENKQTRKRRRPSVKALVLAAALAVGCVLSIAAGLPTQVYNFMTGGTFSVTPAGDGIIGGAETVMSVGGENAPIVLEGGKLWFINGGERTDLTGLIDENTPYIYERTDPATGNKGYVIVGGTVDNFGWAEFSVMNGKAAAQVGQNCTDYLVELPDGSKVSFLDLTNEQRAQLGGEDSFIQVSHTNRPWFDAALDQLGLEY